MGRIKSTAIKRLGDSLLLEYGDRFNADFENNKNALREISSIKSKKIRNVLAGYITKKMRQIQQSGL